MNARSDSSAAPPDELPEGLSADDLRLSPSNDDPAPTRSEGPRADSPHQNHEHHEAHHAPAPAHGGLRDPHPHGDLPDHRELHAAHTEHHAPGWGEFVTGWELGIYRDPVLAGSAVGLVLGVLGVFIVLRRAVFVTAAVSQASGLGVALAFYAASHLGWKVPAGLSALGMAALTAGWLALRPPGNRLPRESWLGFAYLGCSAAALLVGDRITQEAHDIAAILFGTAVLVRPSDLWSIVIGGAFVLAMLRLTARGLVFAGFDADGARVQGLPVRVIELGFWMLVALMVSISTRALGALPVFAFAVLPAMGALAVTRTLSATVTVAGLSGAAAGALGYLFAFFYEFPVGASQALIAVLVGATLLVLSRSRGR